MIIKGKLPSSSHSTSFSQSYPPYSSGNAWKVSAGAAPRIKGPGTWGPLLERLSEGELSPHFLLAFQSTYMKVSNVSAGLHPHLKPLAGCSRGPGDRSRGAGRRLGCGSLGRARPCPCGTRVHELCISQRAKLPSRSL